MSPTTYGILGILAGFLGTLVGAGGGFIIIPALLSLWPESSPAEITATSLLVVFFNGASATWVHSRQQRIDWRIGWLFVLAAVPGSFLGATLVKEVPTAAFTGTFGVLLVVMACGILAKNRMPPVVPDATSPPRAGPALLLSGLVSLLASALGIGGGIFYVPVLVYWFHTSVHHATATSQFVMMLMSSVAIGVHWSQGVFQKLPVPPVAILVVTAMIGAQLGARVGPQLRGVTIVRGLSLVMVTLGIRLVLRAFFP